MAKVVLINQDRIPHYRVPVYNYLSEYLKMSGFMLAVVSGGIQDGNPHKVQFDYWEFPLRFMNLAKFIWRHQTDIVIFWVNLKNLYLFPTLMFTKMMGKKAIYWGHGRDLQDSSARMKNIAYALEHWISDAIILYGEHLKKYVLRRFHSKVFIANNTLNMAECCVDSVSKDQILEKYHIRTKKNIIFMGRMQKRKKLQHLLKAHQLIDNEEVGLLLVGPDVDGIFEELEGNNVYKLGPIYGNEKWGLLHAADIYCVPGEVGLSIVDAFYCGLPMVTEDGDKSPEIMYLKDGVNGFLIAEDDITQLSVKLKLLLEDDRLRAQFSRAAKNEIMENGHIEGMCRGFEQALRYVCNKGETLGTGT